MRRMQLVLGMGVIVSALLSEGCSARSILTGNSTITYKITGSAKHMSITYQSSAGGTSQTGSSVPFTYEYGSAKKGDFVYISAQIDTSPDSGSISATILKNGSTLFTGSASSFPNIATASGSVP
jgi:hypothetical protein